MPTPFFKRLVMALLGFVLVEPVPAQEFKQLHHFKGHKLPVLCVAFSPDGKLLASGSAEFLDEKKRFVPGDMIIWDVDSKVELVRMKGGKQIPHSILALAFSPDGKTLGIGGSADALKETSIGIASWDVAGKKVLASSGEPAISLAFLSNEKIVTVNGTAYRSIFSIDGSEATHNKHIDERLPLLEAVAVDNKSELFAFAVAEEKGRRIKLVEAKSDKVVGVLPASKHHVKTLAFSKDGKFLSAGGLDGKVQLYDVTKKSVSKQFSGHKLPVNGVALNETATLLAWTSDDQNVRLVNVKTSVQKKVDTGFPVYGVCFSPNGAAFAVAAPDGVYLYTILDKKR